MLLRDWIKKKILTIVGLSKYDGREEKERLTLINDREQIVRQKLEEANIWYQGDSDELLNYYTRATHIDWNYEPWYSRNKRGYFWSISSTESDIKRTHSGQPRNIVDTLVSLIGKPAVYGGPKSEMNPIPEKLKEIIDDNNFWDMYIAEQMPMTMVEGWGAYKIDWDTEISDMPLIKYYRAKDVEFIYKDNRMIGIMFKDYYTDGEFKQYLVVETRANIKGSLVITNDVFRIDDSDGISELTQDELPEELSHIDVDNPIKVENYRKLLAVPCVFYRDTSANDGYGRSIFTGKFDLFDDLDQCLSQSSNTVRRSTSIEYFNTDFLPRDKKTGMPEMPKAYDRKFIQYVSAKNADGSGGGTQPVQVTQPQLQFNEYTAEAQAVLLQIINGIMSPATLGIDIARKDNADAQREKEKVTIFTRNTLIEAESRILINLFNQVMEAEELMRSGIISCHDFSISIKYSEFADESFENKLKSLGDAYNAGVISTDLYLEKLYGEALSKTELEREKRYLEENQQQGQNPFGDNSEDGGLEALLGGAGDEDSISD